MAPGTNMAEWIHFTPVSLSPDGSLLRVKCKYCVWGHKGGVSANATRCKKHYMDKHAKINLPLDEDDADLPDLDDSDDEASAEASPPLQKILKQVPLTNFGDRAFCSWQQDLAESKLVLFQVPFHIPSPLFPPSLPRPTTLFPLPLWRALPSRTYVRPFEVISEFLVVERFKRRASS